MPLHCLRSLQGLLQGLLSVFREEQDHGAKAIEASLLAVACFLRFAGASTIAETSLGEAKAMVRRNDQQPAVAKQFAYWLPAMR